MRFVKEVAVLAYSHGPSELHETIAIKWILLNSGFLILLFIWISVDKEGNIGNCYLPFWTGPLVLGKSLPKTESLPEDDRLEGVVCHDYSWNLTCLFLCCFGRSQKGWVGSQGIFGIVKMLHIAAQLATRAQASYSFCFLNLFQCF